MDYEKVKSSITIYDKELQVGDVLSINGNNMTIKEIYEFQGNGTNANIPFIEFTNGLANYNPNLQAYYANDKIEIVDKV